MTTHSPVIIAIQNGPDAPLNLVGKWLAESGFDLRTIHAYAGQPFPTDIDSLQASIGAARLLAIIPLGGSIGALDDDEAPWLANERALLKDAVDHDLPVLGICLGAQLLAASLGGELQRTAEPEIGIHEISIADSHDPIFGALSSHQSLPTIQWHQDVVATLPSASTTIASSSRCRNQIFRIGEIHYGLQFHPEADPTIVRMWEKKGDEAYQRSERRVGISAEVEVQMARLESIWKPVIKQWGEMVLSRDVTQPRPPAPLQ